MTKHVTYFFYCYGNHRDLHVLTHSFPTRRSSELRGTCVAQGEPPDDDRHELADHDGDHRVELGRLPGEERHTDDQARHSVRSEEHTSELQSLMRTSYAVIRLKIKI